jgi:hypothetical protein
MRALAQSLGIASSLVCEVLNGKHNLSADRALQVADRLGLSPEEASYFCLLVQFETTKSPEVWNYPEKVDMDLSGERLLELDG